MTKRTAMRWISLMLAAAAVALPGGCGNDSPDDGGHVPAAARCDAFCETQTSVTACPADPTTCADNCHLAVEIAPWCDAQLEAQLSCVAALSEADFECGGPGDPDPKPGLCDDTLAAVVACRFEGPEGGLPDMGDDCAAYCEKVAGLPCVAADCAQMCLDGVADAVQCNGAFATLVHCIAGAQSSSAYCSAEGLAVLEGDECDQQVMVVLACRAQ